MKMKWILPPSGSAKINVDTAVVMTNAKGVIAAVCRSERGVFLGASAMVFEGISHRKTLEALACRESLELVEDL
jgi:hypothetical protein